MENNKEKKCIICNKPYSYHYDLFGRTCLSNLYKQLNISNSRFILNKEKHLCNVIAHRNFKFFLGKNKKYALVENYIALDYLKKMNLKATDDIKNKLSENIKKISIFKKYTESLLPIYPLNDFYKIYNDYIDFKNLLSKHIKDKNFDETILKGFSIIFDIEKNTNPLSYAVFYELQYMFWEIVVLGGLLKDLKLSAYLMQISLTNSGEYEKEGQILAIEDENITNLLINNQEFKNILNSSLTNNSVNENGKSVEFIQDDLLLAIHIATMNINGTKNDNNKWNLKIELNDKYDFTDIKNLKDYVKSTNSIKKSLLSSTLNNFAAISSSYGVIKPYNFVIKMILEDYEPN